MRQNGSDGYVFSLFLCLLELKLKKGSLALAHDKTWFGRRLCCLVIYTNPHNLPCICVSLGIKVKKRNLRTCQNMDGLEGVSVVW